MSNQVYQYKYISMERVNRMAIPLVVKAAATVHTSVGSCCIADNNFPKLASERTFRLSIFSPRTYKFAAYCRARLQLESLYKWKQACVKDIFGKLQVPGFVVTYV